MVKISRILICLSLLFVLARNGQSVSLTFVSDLISSSAPSAAIDHTITFTVGISVPAGGKIIITPESGNFNIPAGMDYSDIDFLAAQTSGNYSNRNIGSVQTSTEDGITITPGTAGNITIDLNTTLGLLAGNQVKILIGTNAVYGEVGDQRIVNPSTIGSYKIDIRTNDGNQTIENARAVIVVIDPVAVTGEVVNIPPVMSNPNPSGAFSHTVTAIELWMNTDETATCKYSTTSGLSYSSMANTFSNTDDTLHRTVVSNLVASTSYDYYVKCVDVDLNETPTDLNISFSIKQVPPSGTIPGPVGGPEGSGGPPASPTPTPSSPTPSYRSGLPFPTDKASLLLEGLAPLSSVIHVLKDGVDVGTALVSADSRFSYNLPNLDRGVYTFGFYAVDSGGRKSNISNATFSVSSNTGSKISNIIISPIIRLDAMDISPGQPIEVSGITIYKSSVELSIYGKKDLSAPIWHQTIKSDNSGSWSASIDTKDFPNDTYRVRARSILSSAHFSGWTQFQSVGLGVGKPEELNAQGSDFNGDGKINLIDFSILLFNWGGSGNGTASDLNGDSTVNLTDFSILIFNWTG